MLQQPTDPVPVRRSHAELEATVVALEAEVTNLEIALKTARLIGAAIGIVMQRYDLSRDEAFAYLKRLSQDNNVKLHLVADQLIQATEYSVRNANGTDLHLA